MLAVGPGRRAGNTAELIPMGASDPSIVPFHRLPIKSIRRPSVPERAFLLAHVSRSPRTTRAGVKVGDKVLLPDYGGTEVKLSSKDGAKETFLYTDSEILGIVSDQ